MDTKDVLAIDFGTSNTYYCRCSGVELSPKGVDFGGGRDGLASAILYREGKTPLVGQDALDEYGESTSQERRSYKLKTRFKPDIAVSDDARNAARDFLAAVLSKTRSMKLDLAPDRKEVVFGVPSEARGKFHDTLKTLAQEAGYGNVNMVDEPLGALLYHLYHKDIPARDALKGLLVIDFGGGTCDFAFMRSGVVKASWGDMHLGGRLFDDLFFQWFIDSNPDAMEKIGKDGSEYFVHSFLCREVKEHFSRTMARDRDEKVSKAFRHYGRLAEMTWNEFSNRAKAYQPTNHVMEYSDFLRKGPVDLVSWFRKCFSEGLRSNHIEINDIKFVILSGGSSQWPFVADTLIQDLHIDESRIMRSDRPYAAISEGLSIIPALRRKFNRARECLHAELSGFISTKLDPLVKKRVDEVAKLVANEVVGQLFDQKLRPVLVGFRDRGGKVAALKKQLASATSGFEPRLKEIAEEKTNGLSVRLPADVREVVAKWFGEHGLAAPDGSIEMPRSSTKSVVVDEVRPDIYSGIANTVASFATLVVTGVVASICGGGGMALISSGPIGWLIGAIIGIVAGGLLFFYGADKAQEMAENINAYAKISKHFLTDKKIGELRGHLLQDIEAKVKAALEPMKKALEPQVRLQVQAEIDALNEINQSIH